MKIFRIITIYTMSFLYIYVGIKHFIEKEFFINIVPNYITAKNEVVIISGVIEIINGFLLIFKRTRKFGALCTILLLVSVFPANIYLFLSEIARDSIGITKNQALVRLPFQIPLIMLAYWHSKELHENWYNIICCIVFIPTIIYFIGI